MPKIDIQPTQKCTRCNVIIVYRGGVWYDNGSFLPAVCYIENATSARKAHEPFRLDDEGLPIP